MTRLLLAEDDVAISEPLARALRREGYAVEVRADGVQALERARQGGIDLVVLDIGLPGLDGLEVCRRLRGDGQVIPVLVLTARADEVDTVVGLDAGADDYVTKPFGVDELLARLRAVLRRRAPEAGPVIEVGGLLIDVPQRLVTRAGERVKLTPHEFDLLRVLAQNRGKLLTHRMLLREVWGPAYGDEAHYLHVYVSHLRAKIEDDPSRPRLLVTEPGAGYRLLDPSAS
jgi:DNA-binding response OmpR family regulator